MPVNKHALIRYQALDRCFAIGGKRYYWEDLLEAVNESLYVHTGKDKGICRRQLFEDIKYMESDQGWAIPLDRHNEGKRVWYRYNEPDFSTNKRPLNEHEASQLKESLLTLNRFKGVPQFAWVDELVARLESGFGLKQGAERIIEFEEKPYLKGSEHITTLFQAILNKQVLEVKSQGSKQAKHTKLRLHPYYLKQDNNRWFVFGLKAGTKGLTNVELDHNQGMLPVPGRCPTSSKIGLTKHLTGGFGGIVPNALRRLWIVRTTRKLRMTRACTSNRVSVNSGRLLLQDVRYTDHQRAYKE
ncbi:MAG TPA: hypothetical protein PLB89_13870 [Flavobacteriales bacterium]|nr:hypothetical protein [Flavobacteriales bacterium]